MLKRKKKEKLLIGRSEKIDLTDLKLKNLEAKVDTGAYTSSLHCHKISIEQKGKIKYLKFYLLDPRHPQYAKKVCKFTDFKCKKVKSSNGKSETRYIIKTHLKIYGKKLETEFSLSNRSEMRYPVLLGRKFLKQGFVVDVTKTNASERAKQKGLKQVIIMQKPGKETNQ